MKNVLKNKRLRWSLLDVFGDSFSSLRNCVSCQLSGEDELDSWLDLSGRKSSSLVESDELGALSGDSVESVMNEGVDDVHGLLGNADIGVHLLKDLVDVDGEGLNSSSSGFSVSSRAFSFRFLGHLNIYRKQLKYGTFLSIFIRPAINIKYDWLIKIIAF